MTPADPTPGKGTVAAGPSHTWSDRHKPYEHLVAGCGIAAFTTVWTLACGVIALLICGSQPGPGFSGSRASLALHNLAQFQLPFFYPAVLLWWAAVYQFQQVRLLPAGLARTRRVPDGWVAEFPREWVFVVAVGVCQLTWFLTALTPLLLLGKRNPLWVWYLAGPLGLILGVAAYRRWHPRPTIRIDDRRRQIAISRGRRQPPLEVPWDAVQTVDVVCRASEENNRYDGQVTVRVGDGSETVSYPGYGYPEPAERLAQWLRERLADTAGSREMR